MKHKSVSTIAAVEVLHLLFLFSIVCFLLPVNLYSQSTDEQKTGEAADIFDVLLQRLEGKRSSTPFFDIHGTVTDTEGKALDDVNIVIDLSRPDYRNITHSEYEKERITANREFHVKKEGWTRLTMRFSKGGYYTEKRSFHIDLTKKDPSSRAIRETIQVAMIKKGKPAELDSFSGHLGFDFEKNVKDICSLSVFAEKDTPMRRTEIKMNGIDPKAVPEAAYWIELDFKRDEKNNIIYDGSYTNIPCPSSFVIRFHSGNPDDGFLIADEWESGYGDPSDYYKVHTIAPMDGYRQELEFEFGHKNEKGYYSFERKYYFIFVKNGHYYGKILFHPVYLDTNSTDRKISKFRVKIDMDINKMEDDRNLTSPY